ncbi:NAD(P)H-binding protein [Corynebacterium sp. A21]|uniref:NAD(P)H-binding protein n=1 Tax=Corynebacterium sp. A21 TaxID=3457318 RepID=UPI003FCF03A4
MTDRVVILGGHGKVALLATPKFRELGFTVANVIRNPEHESEVKRVGGTPVILDIEHASVDELTEVFRGARAVVFAAGAGGGNPERTHTVDYEAAVRSMAAAEQAGVKRYVMVSYATSDIDPERVPESNSFFPYVRAKHDADEQLRATNLDYTILGPGALTLEQASGKLTLADAAGRIEGREPAGNESDTSRDNVAAVMVHVIKERVAVGEKVNFYDGETPIAEALI